LDNGRVFKEVTVKKSSKSATHQPVVKKPAANKSASRPKRKAQDVSELTQMVARLDAIAEKLTLAVDRLAQLPAGTQPSVPTSEAPQVTDVNTYKAEIPQR
jgi:hypothetical protein